MSELEVVFISGKLRQWPPYAFEFYQCERALVESMACENRDMNEGAITHISSRGKHDKVSLKRRKYEL